jgi:tetratricopeptide (TPR) repeat protein
MRLEEQAQAAARSAEAASRVDRARQLLDAGKLDKAAREAQRALALEPGRADALAALAEIRRRQADEEAARSQAEIARRRARELARALKAARSALRAGDFTLAAWAAENALRIEPDDREAQQLLTQARAALTPAAADQEDTVDLPPGTVPADPDDTAVLEREEGLKRVVTDVRDWASAVIRKLQVPHGQTTTEWVMIAGLLTAVGIFLLGIIPDALQTFVKGLLWGIRTIAP